jgi:hypothetical protein
MLWVECGRVMEYDIEEGWGLEGYAKWWLRTSGLGALVESRCCYANRRKLVSRGNQADTQDAGEGEVRERASRTIVQQY